MRYECIQILTLRVPKKKATIYSQEFFTTLIRVKIVLRTLSSNEPNT